MKTITILISLFFSAKIFAQVEIINRSLTDSSLGIVYLGVENKIEIKTKFPDPKLLVTVRNGVIWKLAPYRFAWSVSENKNSVLTVVDDNGKTIGEKTFKVDTVPPPRVMIPGIKDPTASVNQILLNPFLQVVLPNCFLKSGYIITSFELTTVHEGVFDGDQTPFAISGNRFSEQAIKTIRSLSKGDFIFFDNIKCLDPNSRTRFLPSFYLAIKQ